MTIAGRNVALGAIIAAVGGVVAIVAAPLVWASANMGGHSSDLKGFDEGMNGGLVEVVLGVIVLVLVAAWILNVKVPKLAGQPAIPAGLVVAGALIIVVVALVYFTKTLSEESLSTLSDQMTKAGGSVSMGIALILEVVAGILAIVGGGLALMKKG